MIHAVLSSVGTVLLAAGILLLFVSSPDHESLFLLSSVLLLLSTGFWTALARGSAGARRVVPWAVSAIAFSSALFAAGLLVTAA